MFDAGFGAGMAATAFWVFVAVCVVAGIWDGIRKRETRHETVRRIIESGQSIDQEMLDELLGPRLRPDQSLKIGGLLALFLAPGLAILGWLIGLGWDQAFLPLLGCAALVGILGVGLMVAAGMLRQEAPLAHDRKR